MSKETIEYLKNERKNEGNKHLRNGRIDYLKNNTIDNLKIETFEYLKNERNNNYLKNANVRIDYL